MGFLGDIGKKLDKKMDVLNKQKKDAENKMKKEAEDAANKMKKEAEDATKIVNQTIGQIDNTINKQDTIA